MTMRNPDSSTNDDTPFTVSFEDHKPRFDSQVSALSDRDPTAAYSPNTPGPSLKAIYDIHRVQDQALPENSPSTHSSMGTTVSAKTSVTFGGQMDLPPLPIPSLNVTMDRFLKSIEALDDDPEQSKALVKEFLMNDAPKLQELLVEYDRKGRETGQIGSYVEEFWNDSYLAPDSSVVLNLNPFFVLEDSPDPKIARDPVKRAASLCFASVKLASQLRFENLKPDTFKGKPLCMDQFKALFSTARIPMKNAKDSIYVFDKSNHIAVLCRGSVYYFQVLWPDGHVAVDETDIADILEAIQNHALEEVGTAKDPLKGQQSIGVLTSLPRNEWAQARDDLTKHSPRNAESLKIIDSALFVLVLDDYVPQNKHDAAANMLHGSYLLKGHNLEQVGSDKSASPCTTCPSRGSQGSSDWLKFSDYQAGSCCNRWYDKLQIIVCGDGTAGINFEHSAIDGHTALRFVSDVYAETVIKFAQSITKLVAAHDMIPNVISAKVVRAATALDSAGRATLDVFPKKIHFDIPDSIHRKIYYAETALGDDVVASETFVLEFKDYGKAFITSNGLSPDSFVQMSMILAYYHLYGRIVCAYEPVLTKNFFHGRTEAMRPATLEAKALCEIFTDTAASAQDKVDALRKATKVHSQLVKECSQGMGVDRHLFALKCIAEKKGLPIPPFYHSKAWKLLNHTILSTSNCGNPSLAGFGFGPVVPDGLGIGYIIKEHQLHYSISSKHRQTRRYAYTLESVLKEMAQLFCDQKKNTVGAALRAADNDASRRRLSTILLPMITSDSYGDMWGASAALPDLSQRRLNVSKSQGPSKDGENTKVGHVIPPDELNNQGSVDDLDWDLSEMNLDEAPGSHHVQADEIDAKPSSNGRTRRITLHRQSSKEVGPVQRVPSINYASLSQQGIQIEMIPKPSRHNSFREPSA